MKNLMVMMAATVLVAACSGGAPTASAPIQKNDVEWPLHGLNAQEQRYSTLDQINRETVNRLGLAWSFDLYTKRGVEATPIMVDRTLYVSGSWSMVYALDAQTGALKWFFDPEVDRSFLAKGCCDAVNRGVAYAEGKVIVATYDGRLVALDASNGQVVWDVQTTDRDKSYTITGAPRIAGDKVVIGNGGAEMGVRGYVTAYAIATGKQAWRFYTVPGNPADGFENEAMAMAAKTWTGEWWKYGGGGTAWDAMTYDPELDLLYIGVGNGSPWNYRLRSPEGGDNLFLSSIVAVNPNTGEYVWHYQTTPAETWDYTATQHIMLADLTINGEVRKVLMQAPKNGFFYVLDRTNGELISADPFSSPITWATHIDLATGRPVETPNARVFDGKNISLPSNAGAHNWHPMSFNPELGLVYIPTFTLPIAFLEPSEDKDRLPEQGYWNVGFDRMANAMPKIPEEQIAAFIKANTSGQLIAWDPIKQSIRWAQTPGLPDGGGTLSTAGQLVFHGGRGTHLVATDAATGEDIWWHDAQTTVMAAPITYSLDGVQYIAVAVGIGGGATAEAGALVHSWKVKNRSRVLVYRLDGTHQLPPIDDDTPVMPRPAPVTADVDVQQYGEAMYQRHCSYCHGDGLRTGGSNPDLRWSLATSTPSAWNAIVLDGALSSAGMVGFKSFIGEVEAQAIRQYVLAEANRLYESTHTTSAVAGEAQ